MAVESRRIDDDEIISEVANQLIEGLIRGAIFRRRQRQINNNLKRQQAVAKSVSLMKKFHRGKQQEKEEARLKVERAPTPVQRPATPVLNACHMVVHNEGAESSRGTLGLTFSKVILLSGACLPVSVQTKPGCRKDHTSDFVSACLQQP